MPLTNYVIRCTTRDCPRAAVYKIAAQWSDGLISELKTYALCCAECARERFAEARVKQAACRLTPGESLEAPGIYELKPGERDRGLRRVEEVERKLSG